MNQRERDERREDIRRLAEQIGAGLNIAAECKGAARDNFANLFLAVHHSLESIVGEEYAEAWIAMTTEENDQ